MPQSAHSARIICPYFLRFSRDDNPRSPAGGTAIICEGLVPGSETASCFHGRAMLSRWVCGVCESHGYGRECPLARAVGGKYEAMRNWQ